MCARLYSCDALLERLAQDLEPMTAALGPCILEEHAVMGQRHIAGHRRRPTPLLVKIAPTRPCMGTR
jgi:hypothetical protein